VATNIYAFMNSPNDARLPTIASPHLWLRNITDTSPWKLTVGLVRYS
jgi:hypothetical protein